MRWGATDEEVHKPLPGDEIVPHPMLETTHAVTIDAYAEEIWPWLVQMGTTEPISTLTPPGRINTLTSTSNPSPVRRLRSPATASAIRRAQRESSPSLRT
jgi:hypothetical protein